MADLGLRLGKDMLVVAPLLTLRLLDEDIDGSECLEFFNILDEDLVREAHWRFRTAGAQCVLTNTLRANRPGLERFGLEAALEDVNRAGVQLARQSGFEHIIAVVEATEAEVLCEQVEILSMESPDAFMLVEAADHSQLAASLEILRARTELPIFAPADTTPSEAYAIASGTLAAESGAASGTIQSAGAEGMPPGIPSLGVRATSGIPSPRAGTAANASPPGVAYNMGLGMRESLEMLRAYSSDLPRPFMICPDPGEPEGRNEAQRSLSQSRLADELVSFALEARALGVQFIGTSAGSSPVSTGAIYAAISGLDAC